MRQVRPENHRCNERLKGGRVGLHDRRRHQARANVLEACLAETAIRRLGVRELPWVLP
jgi:hypothetical protein